MRAPRGPRASSGTRGVLLSKLLDQSEDLDEFVWLRDEAVRAHLHGERLIALLRPRRQDDDRDLLEAVVELQQAADLVAVQLGKHEVEQDEIRLGLPRHLE